MYIYRVFRGINDFPETLTKFAFIMIFAKFGMIYLLDYSIC